MMMYSLAVVRSMPCMPSLSSLINNVLNSAGHIINSNECGYPSCLLLLHAWNVVVCLILIPLFEGKKISQ